MEKSLCSSHFLRVRARSRAALWLAELEMAVRSRSACLLLERVFTVQERPRALRGWTLTGNSRRPSRSFYWQKGVVLCSPVVYYCLARFVDENMGELLWSFILVELYAPRHRFCCAPEGKLTRFDCLWKFEDRHTESAATEEYTRSLSEEIIALLGSSSTTEETFQLESVAFAFKLKKMLYVCGERARAPGPLLALLFIGGTFVCYTGNVLLHPHTINTRLKLVEELFPTRLMFLDPTRSW